MSDTTPRDQLAHIVVTTPLNDWGDTLTEAFFNVAPKAEMLADAILAAGFRPPARTVGTVEELDALPVGTVVLDSEGAALAECVGWLWWYTDLYGPGSLALPATVLYEPKEGE